MCFSALFSSAASDVYKRQAMFFAAALTWLLGMLIGSMLAAILIMGGLFVLLALIVYGRRKRLILNQTVRMFSRMMSDLGDKYSDDE